jgi:L-ascorbate metabolism protein UlaG (beta-lactamase superfamily)
VVGLQLTQLDEFDLFLAIGDGDLYVLTPKAQSFLADAAGGEHAELGVLVVADQAHAVGDLFVVFVRLQHSAKLNTHDRRSVGRVDRNAGIIVSGRGMHHAGTAPAGRISLLDQLDRKAVHLGFDVKTPHGSNSFRAFFALRDEI